MIKQDDNEKKVIIEERIRKANHATAEARRRRDTHVKCVIAGELFKKLKIYNIALELETKDEQEAFLNFIYENYLNKLRYNEIQVEKFSKSCIEAVKSNIDRK